MLAIRSPGLYPLRLMLDVVKFLATLSVCALLGVAVGAGTIELWRRCDSIWPAIIGGAVGLSLGLIAVWEISGRWLDPDLSSSSEGEKKEGEAAD